MSVIRTKVMEALLADLQANAVPTIPSAHLYVGAQDWDVDACFPNLMVTPAGQFTFVPGDPDELELAATTVVQEVGWFSGRVVLSVGATTYAQRETLADAVMHRLTSDPLRRGVLQVSVGSFAVGAVTFTGPIRVGFTVDSDSWDDEKVFDQRRYSTIDLLVDLPALVAITGVYTIDTLVLGFNEDLASDDPSDLVAVVTTAEDTSYLEPYP